jgi:hypothetical protein
MPKIPPSSLSPSEDDAPAPAGPHSHASPITDTASGSSVDGGPLLGAIVEGPEPTAPQPPDEPEAPGEPEVAFRLPGLDQREHSLPIRQGDLTRLLLAEPSLSDRERTQLETLGRILGATFHHEFHDILQELKELYAPLDPDSEYVTLKTHSIKADADSDEVFMAALEKSLVRANYTPLDLSLLQQAVLAPNEKGLTFVPDFSLFEHLHVWVRGYTQITRDRRNAQTRFRKQTVYLDAYQRLVLALKFKPDLKLGPYVRSDFLYLRMFKDVPHVDMEMHLPEQGTKVQMRLIDKAQIASPIVMGLPTLALKLFAAVTAVAGAVTWSVMGGLVVAPISAGVNSFFGFHRARKKHLAEMIQRLYYLTLANNASVLTRLIDAAEDEEYKEAMLAYFFLWRAHNEPVRLTEPQLDQRIERYLLEKMGVSINFEVADALGKLVRLGLASSDSTGGLHAVPIEQALTILDRQWDQVFRFS